MTCPVCGRYGDPDPATGYDGSDVCPTCARSGWTITAAGDLICDWPQPRVPTKSTEDEEIPL